MYIARHGETEWNARRILQGQSDSPLTRRGREQAHALADALRHVPFDAVFSSDLDRARTTAEIIAGPRGLPVQTSPALREKRYGSFEGRHVDELFRVYPGWDRLTDEERYRHKIAEDMESNEEAVTRLVDFLAQTARRYAGKTLLVICHGGVMRHLLIYLGTAGYDTPTRIDNAGYMRVTSDGRSLAVAETVGISLRGAGRE